MPDQEKAGPPPRKELDQRSDGPTKRSTEISTEDFKIEILSLPKRPKFHVIKQLLERQFKLTPHKIKLGLDKAYVAFRSPEERDEAIAKINNQQWKGATLIAQPADPRDDFLARKRRDEPTAGPSNIGQDDVIITDKDINNKVCPLWESSYDDQIKFKDTLISSVLKIGKRLVKMCPAIQRDAPKLYDWIKGNDEVCCQYDGVAHSPVISGYRNKCEFNIGRDGVIGFKLGRYKKGSERICRPPANCPILPATMFVVIDTFSAYLQKTSKLKGYDLVTHEGNYRQMTVRCNLANQYLVIVDLHPQNLSSDELNEEIDKATNELKSIDQVVSVYFNLSDKCHFSSSNQSLRLTYGASCLFEHLAVAPDAPLRFRIGPASFFQVNTKGAELLYRSLVEVAGLTEKSMVLDVGCGTGTIGLSLARRVNHVVGIEIIKEAIADAKINAEENGITNVSFFAGKAEDLIGECILILKNKIEHQKTDGEIVAIVDPPRVGFNASFVKTLRASDIRKIIYVACDPKANSNLLTLCRPKSKAYQGEPFVPVRAKAFDLFPHTRFCELLIVYERLLNE